METNVPRSVVGILRYSQTQPQRSAVTFPALLQRLLLRVSVNLGALPLVFQNISTVSLPEPHFLTRFRSFSFSSKINISSRDNFCRPPEASSTSTLRASGSGSLSARRWATHDALSIL